MGASYASIVGLRSIDADLVDLSMSIDDVRLWQGKNLISFDIDAQSELEDSLRWEIEFVRNITRSGLSDAQINRC